MEVTPMIIFLWKCFIVLKLCQFIYYIGVDKPSCWEVVTEFFEILLRLSMIFFGFEVLREIPTWEELLTPIGIYFLMAFVWAIEFMITSSLNQRISRRI